MVQNFDNSPAAWPGAALPPVARAVQDTQTVQEAVPDTQMAPAQPRIGPRWESTLPPVPNGNAPTGLALSGPAPRNTICAVAAYLSRPFVAPFIQIEGGVKNDAHLVLLPKHQYYADVPILGYALHRVSGLTADYIMRPFPAPFGPIFRALGGVEVMRGTELKRSLSESPSAIKGKRALLEKTHSVNDTAFERASDRISRGVPLILFPEKTLIPGAVGEIHIRRRDLLNRLINTQDTHRRIAFVPVGLEYGRMSARVSFGTPLFTRDASELSAYLNATLPALSGGLPLQRRAG